MHPHLDEEHSEISTTGPGAIAGVSVRVTRKFQIGKDNWYGLDALVTLTVSEADAALTDPEELTARAFRIAWQGVTQQRIEVEREAAEEAASRRAQAQARRTQAEAEESTSPAVAPPDQDTSAAPTQAEPPAPASYTPPATADEAERRFYARWGEIVGGQTWASVQRYLNQRSPKPATVEGWIHIAEAVRDQSRAAMSAPLTEAAPDALQNHTNGRRPPHTSGAAPSKRRRAPEF